ncbi:DUF2975 domain-containing protein [Flavobacterium sp. I3-2]|uniref:DUF2975 domain-containing protein n=1 Tax=Flavobacterium sp. I3-2 TaxID=2748319 RepID=UPI0015ACE05F|nr:DUF2975 domain-containing protein [Flavobacterium sp. I3-2]
MRTITILNIILRLIFGIAIITLTILTVILLLAFLNIDLGIDNPLVKNMDINSPIDFLIETILIIIAYLYFGSYIYAIYKLRRCLDLFMEMKFFDEVVIKNFKIIGYIFLVGFLFTCLLNYVDLYEKASLQENIPLSIEFSNIFLNPLNGLIISLFFIVLSNVFKLAKNQKEENIELKQENDLTI